MKNIKYIFFSLIVVFISCNKNDEAIGTNVSDLLWLENKGAQMQILVEGNTASKTFILLLHGGPGGNSGAYNEEEG